MCRQIHAHTYKNNMLIPLLKEQYINNNDILNSLYNDSERLLSPSKYIRVKMKIKLLGL